MFFYQGFFIVEEGGRGRLGTYTCVYQAHTCKVHQHVYINPTLATVHQHKRNQVD